MKIFISSRNIDNVIINGKDGDSLTEIRKYLKTELESISLLDEEIFDVRINEDFSAPASVDSYNKCLEEAREADFCIALYNGAAGWAPAGIDMGICHAEFDEAISVSSKKVAVLDISDYFKLKKVSKDEKIRNESFQSYLIELNTFNNPLKLAKANESNDGFKKELLKSVNSILFEHIKDRLKLSNIYYNLSTNNKIALNWKKLKYTDRNDNIVDLLKTLLEANPDFKDLKYNICSIPDHMSVSDAKAFTGRPFLRDQEIIELPKKKEVPKFGPIHFIGVYGNATETQAKTLIGFPDISSIRDEFGLYVWEQNTHVQLVFLTDCKTPEAVKSKFLLFNNWCKSNGEYINMLKRAEARFHILKSILEAKDIANKK